VENTRNALSLDNKHCSTEVSSVYTHSVAGSEGGGREREGENLCRGEKRERAFFAITPHTSTML